jgi:hypothetical protein
MTMTHWIENDAEWFEQRLVHCGCCGRLIAMHFLVAEIDGTEHIFCSEDCAALYQSYVLPVRGPNYHPPGNATEQYESLIVK